MNNMNLKYILLAIASLFFLEDSNLAAQDVVMQGAEVSQARLVSTSRPLREMEPGAERHFNRNGKAARKEIFNFPTKVNLEVVNENRLPVDGDPLAGNVSYKSNGEPVEIVLERAGLQNGNVYPPDPSGEVGQDYYIQMVNGGGGARFWIFDKEGTPVFGPSSMNSFWAEFGLTGQGDPIVLYDERNKRWMMSEFAPQGDDSFMLLISATSDPTGSWYAYEFQAPNFPDYPKFAIWPDGIYVTTNEGFDSNIPVYVLNYEQMMNGESTADVQRLGVPKINSSPSWQVAAPTDWDGPASPPEGAPGMIFRLRDDGWGGGAGGADRLQMYEVSVNWDNPNQSTVASAINLNTIPFNSDICPTFGECVEQPNGQIIDALEATIMNKVQYRRFVDYEAIVLCHPVNVGNTANRHAGVRWYELRRYNEATWEIHQQGTHAPDELNRIIPSMAMDGAGNICLAYGVASADVFPSIWVTGRKAGDPLGQMTCEETILGEGILNTASNRFGDYFQMSVDPQGERDFWFTGEFHPGSGWSTRVVKLNIDRDLNDLGVSRLNAPGMQASTNSQTEITVEVSNYGILPANNFLIAYQVEGQSQVTEVFTSTITGGSKQEFTFETPAALTQEQDYNIKFFTFGQTDLATFNDTLSCTISVRAANNANILNVEGLNSAVCDTEKTAKIILKNEGSDPLMSVVITYSLNDGPVETIQWTGNILPQETEQVEIALLGLLDGENTIVIDTDLPNNQEDGDISDNHFEDGFYAYLNTDFLTIEVNTDDQPDETTWVLEAASGELLATGGPYEEAQTTYTEEVCTPVKCYKFTFRDSFGDGIASGTPGGFTVYNSEGTIIVNSSNPDFGAQTVRNFCIDVECNLAHAGSSTAETGTDANNGTIILEALSGAAPYQFSIDGGSTFQESPIFENLAGGVYFTEIKDRYDCEVAETVVVMTLTGIEESDNSPAVTIYPNPTPGHFKMEVEGLPDAQTLDVQIYNQAGQQVQQKRLVNWSGVLVGSITLFSKPSGIYYVKIQHGKYNWMEKVILQK